MYNVDLPSIPRFKGLVRLSDMTQGGVRYGQYGTKKEVKYV